MTCPENLNNSETQLLPLRMLWEPIGVHPSQLHALLPELQLDPGQFAKPPD